MLFLLPTERRCLNAAFKKDLKKEDEFMKEHGALGPRLIFMCFDVVFDLFNQFHGLFEKHGR